MPDLQLFPSQIKALQSNKKHTLMLVGRGYGKSYISALWMLIKLLQDPGSNCLLVSPTYQQSKEVVRYLSIHCEKLNIEYSINKVPHWCKCPLPDCKNIFSINTGNKFTYIKIGSADNEDNLRGGSWDRIAIDECCYTSETLFDAILLPTLRGRSTSFNYQLFLTSSPAGASQSWVYRRFIEKKDDDTLVIQAPSYENHLEWNQEKIDYYKRTMSDRFFRQEIEAQCLEWSTKQVMYAFSEHHKLKPDQQIDYDKGKMYLINDMNVDGLTSIIAFVDGNKVYIDDEIVIQENGNAKKMSDNFHKKYSTRPNKSIYMCGDRSTKSRFASSDTTYHAKLLEKLKGLGWNVSDRTLSANPNVYDSSEMVNRKFELNEIMIHPRCKTLIDDLIRGSWRKTLSDKFEIDKSLCRFDAGDCLRYLIWDLKAGSGVKLMNL